MRELRAALREPVAVTTDDSREPEQIVLALTAQVDSMALVWRAACSQALGRLHPEEAKAGPFEDRAARAGPPSPRARVAKPGRSWDRAE